MAIFLIKLALDYVIYEEYAHFLEIVLTIKSVIEGKLIIKNFNKSMVNYNYDLGFDIKRRELTEYINGYNDFEAVYNNTSDNHVKITLAVNPLDINNKSHHTFLVYKSGKVTHSGPNEELIKKAYNTFIDTIQKFRPYIERENPNRKMINIVNKKAKYIDFELK